MIEPMLNFDVNHIPSPCFILDERLLLKNLKLLESIQKKTDVKILCALKGYAMWSTFPLLKKYLAGTTASSLNEAKLSNETFGKNTHLCAPVYMENELQEITDLASYITFNSCQQFEKFGKVALEKKLKIALRINPEYSEVATDLYNPCIPGSRLGVSWDQMPENLPDGITGLHCHTLCEQNADTLERTLIVIEEKFEKYLKQITWFNIGGGHLFTSDGYNVELFTESIKAFSKKYELEIIAEPGAAIGWNTGYLLTTVQDIVYANGKKTAMLDASFTAHMPDCLEMPYKPNVICESKVGKKYPYRLGGNTCLAGDFIDGYYFDSEIEINDKIIFEDMMHYTMVKTNTFNGVNLPAIGVIKSDASFQLIKSFDYQHYKERLS